jgi:hypothetical protein
MELLYIAMNESLSPCVHCRDNNATCNDAYCERVDVSVNYDPSWMCRPCYVRLFAKTYKHMPISTSIPDNPTPGPLQLGDAVAAALSTVGVTHERVATWLGKDCGCKERQARLNMLGAWARRVLAGKLEGARDFLQRVLGVLILSVPVFLSSLVAKPLPVKLITRADLQGTWEGKWYCSRCLVAFKQDGSYTYQTETVTYTGRWALTEGVDGKAVLEVWEREDTEDREYGYYAWRIHREKQGYRLEGESITTVHLLNRCR